MLRLHFWSRGVIAAAVVALVATALHAQDAPRGVTGGRAPAVPAASTEAQGTRLLPADQTTAHSLDLPGRNLKFSATAGSIALRTSEGKLGGEMAYIAYQLDGADALKRPVTFAFNGGPGSSSAWVHIGGFGPWRLPLEGAGLSPSALPTLLPNAETWLDFTDLVFIDPIGTGFSRPQAGNTTYYGVESDANAVAEMIAQWLRKAGRLTSPKIIAGESYGGIRAPWVVSSLQSKFGVGVNGLVLVSPLFDYGWFRGPRHHVPMFINTLPSVTAAARESQGKAIATRADLADVEDYARGPYLVDLMRGPRDAAAFDRIVKNVTAFSGLPEPIVRSHGARISEWIYLGEAFRATGKRASAYDASVTGLDPDPTGGTPHGDPFSEALGAPMKSTMLQLYDKLKWKSDSEYQVLATDVNRAWNWGSSGARSVESFTTLRQVLAIDPSLRVLVTHGFTDLRTPYFASVLLLEQLPVFVEGRVALQVYPGGHMHYSREGSRIALRRDVNKLIEDIVSKDPGRQ